MELHLTRQSLGHQGTEIRRGRSFSIEREPSKKMLDSKRDKTEGKLGNWIQILHLPLLLMILHHLLMILHLLQLGNQMILHLLHGNRMDQVDQVVDLVGAVEGAVEGTWTMAMPLRLNSKMLSLLERLPELMLQEFGCLHPSMMVN